MYDTLLKPTPLVNTQNLSYKLMFCGKLPIVVACCMKLDFTKIPFLIYENIPLHTTQYLG